MSRKTCFTLLLIIVWALLAVALFIAGAIWRGRVTAWSALTDSRKLPVTAKLAASGRRQSEEASGYVPGGLARALSGESAGARTAYQDFFALWRDADSDIPILEQAKAEYAKLR